MPSALRRRRRRTPPSPWQRELTRAVTTLRDLERHLDLDDAERAALQSLQGRWPLAWTPHVLHLLPRAEPAHPLRRQLMSGPPAAIAAAGASDRCSGGDRPDARATAGLLRCHGERALLRVDAAPASPGHSSSRALARAITPAQLDLALEQLRGCAEVRELILGGDDPLLLDDGRLEMLLRELRTVRQVERIRLLTRLPVLLPSRCTARLVSVLRRARPLFVGVRVNNAIELDRQVAQALQRCLDAGLPLLGHTTLLRGVNDDEDSMRALLGALLRLGITPAVLVPAPRASSLAVSAERAAALVEGLRARLGEVAVPRLAKDDPLGEGAP